MPSISDTARKKKKRLEEGYPTTMGTTIQLKESTWSRPAKEVIGGAIKRGLEAGRRRFGDGEMRYGEGKSPDAKQIETRQEYEEMPEGKTRRKRKRL